MNINNKKPMYVDHYGNMELAQDTSYIDDRIKFILGEIKHSYSLNRVTGVGISHLYTAKWRTIDWRHYYHCVVLEDEAR